MAQPSVQKRKDYIGWDDYFMATAVLASERSKDPFTQVGACIVDDNKKIVGTGYNGMPIGCSDDKFPWDKKTPSALDDRDTFVCHAEMNAIIYRNAPSVKGCTMYVTLFPCNECAKLIIQSGIAKIYYLSDEKAHKDTYKASKKMLKSAGIDFEQLNRSGTIGNKIKINWDTLKGPSGGPSST